MFLSDNSWWKRFVKSEFIFNRLSREKQDALIFAAFGYAEDMANKVAKEYGVPHDEKDATHIAGALGAAIKMEQQHFSPFFVAEYCEEDREIICYLQNIKEVEKRTSQRFNFFERYSLLTMCIIHELFHHIEGTYGTTCDYSYLNVKLLCFFNIRYSPQSMREIAAHLFVQKLLSLDFCPAQIFYE